MADSEQVRNEAAGSVAGHSVQAGRIHGDVHFHQAAGSKTLVPRQLPTAVRHFVDRAVELDALTTLLNGAGFEGGVLLSTIGGVAGVGKSTLMVHWAHRVRDRFPDGDLYVNLRGFDPAAEPMSPAEALAAFVGALGFPGERIPEDVDARAALFRSAVHGKRLLILLDNARSADQVRVLLPGSPSCLVLVSSRNRLDELVVREGASRLSLEVLPKEQARELLARYLGRDRLEAEPEAAQAVIEYCAGLPLALSIVAVWAAEISDLPLDDVVEELRDERERLDALDAGGETGVRAVFSWSYHSLSAGAARLFRLLGLPTGPDISLAAAADLGGHTLREARKLLAELTRAHLLDQHTPGRFRFHDLLRAYAAECAAEDENADERQAAILRLLDHYLRTSYGIDRQLVGHSRPFAPPLPESSVTGLTFDGEQEAQRWWDDERENLLAAIRRAQRLDLHEHVWQLTYTLMYYFRLRGHLTDWVSNYEAAIDSVRTAGDQAGEAHLLFDLGIPHYVRGQYQNSLRYQGDALARFEAMGDQPAVGRTLIALGETYLELRDFEKARGLMQRGLDLYRELGDVYGQGLAHAAHANLKARLNQRDAALEHYHRALPVFREFGEKYGVAFILNALAEIHHTAGRPNEAIENFRQAVGGRREIAHREGEADSLLGLGVALHNADNLDRAREAWSRALAIYEDLGHHRADEVRNHLNRSLAGTEESPND